MSAEPTGIQTVTPTTQVVTLTINDREVNARPGQTILEAAQGAGIDIPTLCYDPRLEPYGACRMCLVEVEGARGPMAACGTAIREGMKVQTHSEKIRRIRRFVLELLLTNHPLDCPVCEAAGDCKLQDYAYEYLVDMVPWGWRGPLAGDPGDHPNIAHFGARCILCGRCVRICREVMSIGCWGYLNRGYDSEVDTPYRLPLQEVDCVSCGQCVSTCPVGAIVGQRSLDGARAWQTAKTVTTCSYCADGCTLVLHSYQGKVVKVASQVGTGINNGNLCVKGRFGMGYAEAPDRLTTPWVRNAKGELEEGSWEDAFARIKDRLASVNKEKGGQGVAAICGTNLTNEAAYLVQKFMRSVVGSNNIDAIDHLEQAASEEALAAAFGICATTNSRKDLAQADVILVVGANLTESDPVFALDVIKAIRSGKTVIVIDPRTTELAAKAKFHLAVKPGTALAALRGLMKQILELGLDDKEFIASRTEGFAAFEKSLAGVDVAAEAATCGIDAGLLRAAGEAFGQADAAAVIFAQEATRGELGGARVAAIADLVLLTGNVGRPGTGVYPLLGGANSQGLSDMGVRPDRLPGGAALTGGAGVGLSGMITAIESGEIDALYVVGADPALALADERRVRKALEKVGFLVVQDSFLSDTAQYADVVLPAAVAGEDEGTFTNAERLVQRVRPAVPAKGESLPDWRIVQLVAEALGADWAYKAPVDIMREISEAAPAYKGVSYDKLECGGVQWPCTATECPGTAVLHTDGFANGKAAFAPVKSGATTLATDAEFPLVLMTGPVREHHGTGVRTRRSQGVTKLVADPALQMSADDAKALGLANGDKVSVSARNGGTVEVAVCVSRRMPAGVAFLPGFSPEAPVTRLQSADEPGPVAVKVQRLG
ncbi:MAG: molybdopterin-dependent oxidoreductase [Thermoleophilia bacterium]|nr:molybdopterin-dependent oxidoreductase [Thermoleophilia bacterium]